MQMNLFNLPPSYSHVSTSGIPSVINPGDSHTGSITIKNTGLATWYADGAVPAGKWATRLAMKGYAPTPFSDTTDPNWLNTNNQIKMTPAVVNSGENATFTFNLKGSLQQIESVMHFVPVLDGITFMDDIRMFHPIVTPPPRTGYNFVSAVNPPKTMPAGSTAIVSVTLKNTGNVVWKNESATKPSIRLMMTQPSYRSSVFFDSAAASNWLAPSQIGYTGPPVGLDGTLTFTFNWKAPAQPGTYTERFAPVLDGYQALEDKGMAFTVTVTP